MRTGQFFLLVAVVLVGASTGCDRPPPSMMHVDGRNFGAFYYWRSSVSSQFTPTGWAEFNAAVDELRLQAMSRGVTGRDAIDQAMCDAINGRTVDEVLRMADEAKLGRLEPMRDRLKEMIDANALLAPRPGDSNAALSERLTNQRRQLQKILAEIEATKAQLVAHGGDASRVPTIGDKPAVLSRTQALRDFDRMIETRRENAQLMFGDWPARIDRKGAGLVDKDRALFLERKAAARTNGHVVIPVYVRSCWWIYDAAVDYPEFSESVTGNLTAADRRAIADRWADSEAEAWARKQASKLSADEAIAKINSDLKAVMRP